MTPKLDDEWKCQLRNGNFQWEGTFLMFRHVTVPSFLFGNSWALLFIWSLP